MNNTSWITEDHIIFQETVKRFFADEIMPHEEAWEAQGMVDRDIWHKAGAQGLLGAGVPEEYGGYGGDFGFDALILEHQGRLSALGWGFIVQTIVKHYIVVYGTEDQKEQWLPKLVSGEYIPAIAMTEPGTGSDLQAVKTRAVKTEKGYLLNGSKIFITNGQQANFIVTVVKTNPEARAKGISLVCVTEEASDKVIRGKNLDKLGMKSQDTSELFFEDVEVPATAILGGEEGQGFYQLSQQLAWERLCVAYWALGACEGAVEQTLEYVKQRKAFGKRILDFQNTRFKLAECRTKTDVTRAYLDQCMNRLMQSKLTAEEASMAKWWATEVQGQVVDECLQLHGGYGYMNEYPIAKLYRDARVQRIYGGTTEIMKEMIARKLDS